MVLVVRLIDAYCCPEYQLLVDPGSNIGFPKEEIMSTLDDIAAQRERIADRLARIDAERAKLADELAELEAAERVVSRFTQPKSAKPRRGRVRQTEATEPVVARGRRGRTGRAKRSVAPKTALPLGDAALRAIEA